MSRTLIEFLALWTICDIINWGMVSGLIREHTDTAEPKVKDRLLIAVCLLSGPVGVFPLLLNGCWRYWAWRPETTKEIEQRLMLRKLEE